MLKNILPLFLLAALQLSCNQTKATDTLSEKQTPVATEQTQPQAKGGGTYVGTIPCADCAGIKVELTLVDGKQKTYLLKQTYLGKKGAAPTESRGKWFAATGNSQNAKAVIYQLIPDKAYEPLYFLRLSDTRLKMLDHDQNEIKSKANYTLQKQ
ncbi:copper resistance protein NlpE [Pontibacter chitinilyticus]|uniref:copper resistance protein NlpE n=1 Tax=Pontibacter chitinilyticus TaxID=2674989 RepID=UPI00321A0DC6